MLNLIKSVKFVLERFVVLIVVCFILNFLSGCGMIDYSYHRISEGFDPPVFIWEEEYWDKNGS